MKAAPCRGLVVACDSAKQQKQIPFGNDKDVRFADSVGIKVGPGTAGKMGREAAR